MRLFKVVLYTLLAWLFAVLVTLGLCHMGWLGFAMGITIATGMPNVAWTFGFYGFMYAIPAIYFIAAWCGDNL